MSVIIINITKGFLYLFTYNKNRRKKIEALNMVRRIQKKPQEYDIPVEYLDCIPTDEILDALAPEIEINHPLLLTVPDDDTLHELSTKIGNCAIRLGIELDVPDTEIDKTSTRYSKDIFQQNYDILVKWKNKYGKLMEQFVL